MWCLFNIKKTKYHTLKLLHWKRKLHVIQDIPVAINRINIKLNVNNYVWIPICLRIN